MDATDEETASKREKLSLGLFMQGEKEGWTFVLLDNFGIIFDFLIKFRYNLSTHCRCLQPGCWTVWVIRTVETSGIRIRTSYV